MSKAVTPNVDLGSKADLQRPLNHCRLSARNETFGTERPESARKRTFRRSEAKVGFVPNADTPILPIDHWPSLPFKSTFR